MPLPEGDLHIAGLDDFEAVVRDLRGPEVAAEWRRFVEALRPIAAAADALPLLALRPGVDGMAQLLKPGRLLPHLAAMRHLSGSFGPLVDRHSAIPAPLGGSPLLSDQRHADGRHQCGGHGHAVR